MAAIPGTASADSSDWLSSVDTFLTGAALPAAAAPTDPNLAISFDGITLWQEGTAYAYTGSNGDIAIANGAGATASALGTNNYAAVDGTDSSAIAGGYNAVGATGSSDDTAFVFGNDSHAFAGGMGGNPGSFDYSLIFGNNDAAYSGADAAGAGSYDGAYVEGNDLGTAYAQGANYVADILKFYGDGSTSAAAESGNLADLLSSTTGAAADSSNFLTDLASLFDPAGAAADSSHLLTEIASLF